MTTQIIRHDRGLDSKRIEKIIGMIVTKIGDIKYDRHDVMKERKSELKKEVIKLHSLQPNFDAISEINIEIEALEKQISELKSGKVPHQHAIAKIMRGYEETYNYSEIRDDSPADQYLKERLPDLDAIKAALTTLSDEMEEQLWLAKDIDEARGLYNHALSEIEKITKSL
jgi:signal transduction protein with GAF and PtsI domain